jgi:hypothetical protein
LKEENILLMANVSSDFQMISKSALPKKWQGNCFREEISSVTCIYQGDTLFIPPYGVLWLTEKAGEIPQTKEYRLKMEAQTIPGESVYFIENISSVSIGEKARKITCYWVDDLGWHADVNLVPGAWISYHWVKMYGNNLIEKSKDYYHQAK